MTYEIITPLLTFAGTLLGFWYGSKKSKAEADGLIIKNVKALLDLQNETIEKLRTEIEGLRLKINQYEQYITTLKDEIHQMGKDMKK
jgi:predicted RNase H-like nuclease (RuvC/YqgF family)